MSWVDAHCHLDSERGVPAEVALREAAARRVEAIVMAGVDPAGWRAQSVLAGRFCDVYPVFGVHPQVVPELSRVALEEALHALEAALGGALGVRPVALGELGLDRLTEASRAALPLQEVAFREQLRLARRFELPVVLHLLRSEEAALRILREEGLPARGGMVHSYSGAREFAQALVRLGLHVSFCGSIARPQSRRLRESAQVVPAERLLVETDAPDQSPPGAGVPNVPGNLPEVAAALAEARGESLEAVAVATTANACRLFGIPMPRAGLAFQARDPGATLSAACRPGSNPG